MTTNLDKYKSDLDSLIARGEKLYHAIQVECYPEVKLALEEHLKEIKAKDTIASFPSFKDSYQSWYSEAKALIRQLLPDRLDDFVRHYEKPKPRKDVTHESYRIEDYLQGIIVTRRFQKEKVVGPDSAIPQGKRYLAS
jgi:hypothetical protein